MSLPPVSLSPDIQQLLAEGYEVRVQGNHLVVGHIPYLDDAGVVRYGEIVSELNVTGDQTARPNPHTVYFTGVPHQAASQPMHEIIAAIGPQQVVPGMTLNSYLSTKPVTGYYENYYNKLTQYIRLISGRARTVDPEATARTFRPVKTDTDESPFMYLDSASARAGISDLSQRLAAGPVGIIGLGGSGSYILDLVAKTPVPAIHIWDPDVFLAHNAFRAPGAATLGQLNERLKKVDYFAEQYSAMHRGIVPHAELIEETNLDALTGLDMVFIAIDTGPMKRMIIDWLVEQGIPLIDVGMGVHRQGTALGGIVRTTTVTPDRAEHVERRISFADEQEDEYDRNIQLADLNALNAALAVIKWKKLKGFYRDERGEAHTTYTIAPGQLTNSELQR